MKSIFAVIAMVLLTASGAKAIDIILSEHEELDVSSGYRYGVLYDNSIVNLLAGGSFSQAELFHQATLNMLQGSSVTSAFINDESVLNIPYSANIGSTLRVRDQGYANLYLTNVATSNYSSLHASGNARISILNQPAAPGLVATGVHGIVRVSQNARIDIRDADLATGARDSDLTYSAPVVVSGSGILTFNRGTMTNIPAPSADEDTGYVDDAVRVQNSGRLYFLDGEVATGTNSIIGTYGSSVLRIHDGEVAQGTDAILRIRDNSIVEILGGLVGSGTRSAPTDERPTPPAVDISDAATMNIYGGQVATSTRAFIRATGEPRINVYADAWVGSLSASGDTVINVFSGSRLDNLSASGNSVVRYFDGSLELARSISAWGGAEVIISGSDFRSTGGLVFVGDLVYGSGVLTGNSAAHSDERWDVNISGGYGNIRLTSQLQELVADPFFDPDGGAFPGNSIEVRLDCATAGAVIHYTTNGLAPTQGDPAVLPGQTVMVDLPGTLKARAFGQGQVPSQVVTREFTMEQRTHPADLNQNWSISMAEAIAYLADWQRGHNQMGWAIRAAFLWQNGEKYFYNPAEQEPMSWQPVVEEDEPVIEPPVLSESPEPGFDWISPTTGIYFVWIERMGIWVAKHEVTNRQYRLKEADHDSGYHNGESLNLQSQPVVQVNFEDARQYANWLNQQFREEQRLGGNYKFRLPTGDEWRTFAQVGDFREFPWGPSYPPPSGIGINYSDSLPDYQSSQTVSAPVDEVWRNPWGLRGVGGNVWEVTTKTTSTDEFDGWKGGSWRSLDWQALSCTYRDVTVASFKDNDRGFRLVMVARD